MKFFLLITGLWQLSLGLINDYVPFYWVGVIFIIIALLCKDSHVDESKK